MGSVKIRVKNLDPLQSFSFHLEDHAYGQGLKEKAVAPLTEEIISIDTKDSFGWYDFSLKLNNFPIFVKRYAGRVEFGKPGKSDPQMGIA